MKKFRNEKYGDEYKECNEKVQICNIAEKNIIATSELFKDSKTLKYCRQLNGNNEKSRKIVRNMNSQWKLGRNQ